MLLSSITKSFPGVIALNDMNFELKSGEIHAICGENGAGKSTLMKVVTGVHAPDSGRLVLFGTMEDAKRDIDRFGKDYFVIGDCELSLFELAWHLTGLENYMVNIASGEDWIEALNDKVEYFTTGIAEQLVRAGVDAVWFGEDLGTQVSTLISPDMWRKIFRPRHERIIKKIRAINPDVLVIMHSDGAVAPLLDDFIEMGIDIYNPVQPNVPGSDPRELKDKYGDRICFFGGLDQQRLMPEGDMKKIEADMRNRAAILGEKGGYLMAPAHIIQADVAPETVEGVLAVLETL